jgi:hypothetical protein
MKIRYAVPVALLFVHTLLYANIEWPVLYSVRAVGFTESLIRECNVSFPGEASARLAAFEKWKVRNESVASKTRDFNIARVRKEDPKLSLDGFEKELDQLEKSAISQSVKSKTSWETMCKDMSRWLISEESDVAKQVPDFMRAR